MPQNPAAPVLAVLFDYGLVLTGPPDPDAWAIMQEVTGFNSTQLDEAYWADRLDYDRGTHTGASFWQAVGAHHGIHLDDAQIAELLEADITLWTAPNQPLIDFAARLQRAGTPTGILSNLGDAITAGILAKLPWLARFDFRLFSWTLKSAKPDPALYAAAARGLRTPPANILFLDDREDNVAAARAHGMQAVHYTTPDALVESLAACGLSRLWQTGALK